MITRNFENQFDVTDYTSELMLIPNQWNLVGSDGVFTKDFLGTNNVTFERTEQGLALLGDKPWGERASFSGGQNTKIYNFQIPHFPLDDMITAKDIQKYRAVGTADTAEAVNRVRMRKMETLRRSHAQTIEYARCQALQGLVYSPNSTVPYTNWFTEFGIAQTTVDFDFAVATDMIAKCEAVIASIQDNANLGQTISEVVGYCSPTFFASLISHAAVVDAYTYYSSRQEPTRERLGTGIYREFMFGGIHFKEYRGTHNGSAFLPADEAYFVPKGLDDVFVEYYAPACRLDIEGLAQEAYMFEYPMERGRQIDIESESNFLVMLKHPKLAVKATST